MSRQQEIESAIEAVLFTASEPVKQERLLELFDESGEMVEKALQVVLERYSEDSSRGVMIDRVAGGIRLVTRPELNAYLRKYFQVTSRSRLSMAALETLAIVAYRQPITAPEIQEVRGVAAAGVLKTLLEHRLVRIAGRKEVVGKPFLYCTTREFLLRFGLESLKDLPPLDEIEDLLAAQLQADTPDESGDDSEQDGGGDLLLWQPPEEGDEPAPAPGEAGEEEG
jgi:segregation and condensation protein B